MTHTYAILDVPRAVYAAVRALLDAASYQHAFHADKDGEVINMHGIALRSKAGPTGTDITVSTILISRDKTGRIDFTLNGELTQMDLDKAREVIRMLQGAVEAKISDEEQEARELLDAIWRERERQDRRRVELDAVTRVTEERR